VQKLTAAILRDAATYLFHPANADDPLDGFSYMCSAVRAASGEDWSLESFAPFLRTLELHGIETDGSLAYNKDGPNYTPFYRTRNDAWKAHPLHHPEKQEVRYMFLLFLAESGVF
jgi:hypothetical protein